MEHTLERVHREFDNALAPALTINPGDTVTFKCPGPALPRDATVEDLATLDFRYPHVIVGPVEVSGADPGDALVVDVLDVRVASTYGHCFFRPGRGLLIGELQGPYICNFEFADGFADLGSGIRIPIAPFCGIMGVAPSEPGSHSTIPPTRAGGNMDIRQLVSGSRLILPVMVSGALFSCGDGHAAQGDGEVCSTAIETAVDAVLRFTVDKGANVPEPRVMTAPIIGEEGRGRRFMTTAVGNDLHECARRAVRYMVDYLEHERGLLREESYVLTSVAASIVVNEVVNAPHWLVSCQLPLAVFAGAGAND